MHLQISISLIFAFSVTLACNSENISSDEKREFNTVERAINTLASAPSEDRGIRLQELKGIEVRTERIRKLRDLCVKSYQSFEKATQLLGEARAKTLKTESMMAKIRAGKDAGTKLSVKQESKILEVANTAASSLGAVNKSLDRAEELVTLCEERRGSIRALLAIQ